MNTAEAEALIVYQRMNQLQGSDTYENMMNSEYDESSSSVANEEEVNTTEHEDNQPFSGYSTLIDDYQLSVTVSSTSKNCNDRENVVNDTATSNNDSERSFPSDRHSALEDRLSNVREDTSQADDEDDNNENDDIYKPKMSLLELAQKLKQTESKSFIYSKSRHQSDRSDHEGRLSQNDNSLSYDDDSLMSSDGEDDYHSRLYGDDYVSMIEQEIANSADKKSNNFLESNFMPTRSSDCLDEYFDSENGWDLSCSSMRLQSNDSSPSSQKNGDLLLRRRHACRFCKYSTDRLSHLRRHELSIHYRGGISRQRAAPLNGSQSERILPSDHHITPMVVSNPDGLAMASPEKRKHQCEFCSYQTDCISHLRRHMGSVHDREKLFRCNVCTDVVEFARSEKVKEHFRMLHPEVECDLKQLRTPQPPKPAAPSPVRVHPPPPPPSSKRTDDDPTDIDDAIADAELAELVNQSIANKIKGMKPFKCPLCEYAARDVWHMRRHIGDRHVRQRHYKCRVCRYETRRIDRLFTHQRSHGEMFCLYCESYSTAHADSYKRHMISCASETTGWTWDSSADPFSGAGASSAEVTEQERTCRVCNIVYDDAAEWELHIDSSHVEFSGKRRASSGDDLAARQLMCKLCSFLSQDRVSMRVHVSSHAPLSFPCTVLDCDFKATYARTLELHRRFYHGVKQEPSNKRNKTVGANSEENSLLEFSMNSYMPGASNMYASMGNGNLNGFNYNPYLNVFFGTDDTEGTSAHLNEILRAATMGPFSGALPPQIMAYLNEIENYHREMYGSALSHGAHNSQGKGPHGSMDSTGSGNESVPLFSQPSSSYRSDSPDMAGTDSSSGVFKCPVCVDRAPFKYRRSYEKHLTQHASALNLCPLCTETFSSANELQRHLVAAHSSKTIWNNGQH